MPTTWKFYVKNNFYNNYNSPSNSKDSGSALDTEAQQTKITNATVILIFREYLTEAVEVLLSVLTVLKVQTQNSNVLFEWMSCCFLNTTCPLVCTGNRKEKKLFDTRHWIKIYLLKQKKVNYQLLCFWLHWSKKNSNLSTKR